jgi:hypothetical protein
VALRCPGCQAPLDVSAVGAAIRCHYCGITSRIGPAIRRSLGSKDVTPPRWWALFRGPSEARTRGERIARAEAERQAQNAARAEQSARANAGAAARADAELRQKKQIGMTLSFVVLLAGVAGAAFVLQSAKHKPAKPSTHAASAPPKPSPAPPAPTFTVTWNGKVEKATGKPLRVGTPCQAEMTAKGKVVTRVRVACGGGASLYDSDAPISGMSNLGAAIIEAPADQGHRYLLAFHDVGARTGRSELDLNTVLGRATVSSHSGAAFEVTIALDDLSGARAGAPVFTHAIDTTHALFDAKATSVTGKAPVAKGQLCSLDFVGRGVKEDGDVCTAKLTCARKDVVWSTSYCKLDAAGKPATFDDGGSEMSFSVDAHAATAHLSGHPIGGAYDVSFALTAHGAR